MLLNGSKLIMVVRKTASDSGRYHLVGPAQVAGVSSQMWEEVARLEGVEDILLV